MRKLVAFLCVVWSSIANAQTFTPLDAVNYISLILKGINFSLSDIVPKEVTVNSTGIGETQPVAIENALNDAVQKSMGVLVVTEQTANNERLIKNIIAQYSSGVVNSYEIKSCSGKPVVCEIVAKVSPWNFMRKLEGDSNTLKIDGKNLLARHQTTKNAMIQRRKMAEYYMSQIRQSGLDLKIISLDVLPSNKQTARLQVEYEIQWNKHFKNEIIKFLEKLEKDTAKEDDNHQVYIQWNETGFDENRVRINTYDESFYRMMYRYMHDPVYIQINELGICEDAKVENVFAVDWYGVKRKKTLDVEPSKLANINTLSARIGCGKI